MPTDKDKLSRGIQYLASSLPLMFIGPSVIYNAFMNQHTNWHYLVLGVGITVCITAVFFAFKGIKTMTDAMFDGDK